MPLLPEEARRVLRVPRSAQCLTVSITCPSISLVFANAYVADIYDCAVVGDVALTFDDGPDIYTDEIVNLLNSYGARATFFITGINNGKGAIDITPAWNAVIKKMYSSGHQLASHTWSHADLSTLTEDARRTEMVRYFRCIPRADAQLTSRKTVQTRNGNAQHRRIFPNLHATSVLVM